MSLVFGSEHPLAGDSAHEPGSTREPLRIGIVNLMPRLETYEASLLRPLATQDRPVRPVFLRLESHVYRSSNPAHLARHYRTHASLDEPLDGLLLTGAPIEHLEFSAVRYWRELVALLDAVRAEGAPTLGVCWGGLALASLAGIPKRALPQKRFGVFAETARASAAPLLPPGPFVCAQSRHAGLEAAELERAERDGRIEILSDGEEGSSLLATPDRDRVMHLGHPEYEGPRLAFEWQRDLDQGRTDVPPPRDFDATRTDTPWRGHRDAFFAAWLDLVAERRH